MKHNYLPEPRIRVEGVVPLSQGGTNATTIEQARANLKIIERESIGLPGGPVPLDPLTGLIPAIYFEDLVASSVELDGPLQVPVDTEVQYTITNRDSRLTYVATTSTGTVRIEGDKVIYRTPVRWSTPVGFTVNGVYFRIELQEVFRIPNKALISSPLTDLEQNSEQFTFSSSPWSTNYPEDSLDQVEWEVGGNQSFTAPAPAGIIIEPQGYTLTVRNVPPNSVFYVRVRHLGYYGYNSPWSDTRRVRRPPEEKPGKPDITSPSANGVVHTTPLLFQTSPFVKGSLADTHASTKWQIASDANFTQDLQELTIIAQADLRQYALTLTRGRSYYVRVAYTSNLNWTSDWSDPRIIQYVPIEPPVRPTITTPSMNVVINATFVTVESSSFTGTAPGDTFDRAEWQRSTSLTFDTNLVEQNFTVGNPYQMWYNTGLEPGLTYYYRVRYRGASGWYSDWSLVRQVTYGAVLKPSITYPTAGQERLPLSFTVVSTAFQTAGLSTTHFNTDWQIATDAAFSYVVKSSLASEAAKTAWPIESLEYGTTYYVRVRHRSANNYTSAWSDPISFKTKAAAWDPLKIAEITIPINTIHTQDKQFEETPSLSVSNNGKYFAFLNKLYKLEAAGPVLIREFTRESMYAGLTNLSVVPLSESFAIGINPLGTEVSVLYAADVSSSGPNAPSFIFVVDKYTLLDGVLTLVEHKVSANTHADEDSTGGTTTPQFFLDGFQNTRTQGRVFRFSNISFLNPTWATKLGRTALEVSTLQPTDPHVNIHTVESIPADSVNPTAHSVEVVDVEAGHEARHYMESGFFAYADGVDRSMIKYYASTDTNAASPLVVVVADPLTQVGSVIRPVDWKVTSQWMKHDMGLFMTIQNNKLRIYSN